MEQTPPQEEPSDNLKWLETATRFLDNQFRIPGTDIRFGFDFLVGLIPGVGDIVSMGISGLLVTTMVRKGASGMVVVKMIGNIVLDALAGTIPFLGDIFDLTFRANRRNLNLLKEHYKEGEHQGSAWPVVLLLLLVFMAIFVGVIYLVWQILRWYYDVLTGL
ncbi:MAG: DUF4112 domain-containing protein [Saprospiraceae bacterium]